MAKNLYVGNLSFSVRDDELNALFAQYGTVLSAHVIIDRDTQRSKGFGFVEMADDTEAQTAIDALNGKENNGRTLTVNEAKPREPRPSFGGRPRGERRY
jgi:RNA recognition motif-containing protein